MILDDVRSAVDSSGFATGFFVGSLALAAGVVILALPRSGRRVVPLAGLLLVGAALVALADQARLPDELVPGVGLLAVAGALVAAAGRLHLPPAGAAAVLAIPGAWLVAGATGLDETGPRLVLVATIALAGALVGAADHEYRQLGLGPILLLATLAGAYATVPDTERVLIVLGAALPLSVLGWPWPLASLGRAGAAATVGLLAWVAVTDGSARAGSTVGAMACLGILLVEPVARVLRAFSVLCRSDRPQDGRSDKERDGVAAWRAVLPIVFIHLVLVTVASRIAGFRSSAWEAGAIAGVALVIAVVVAVRWPVQTAGHRHAPQIG